MKETERSLRAYFLIFGLILVLMAFRTISDARTRTGIELPSDEILATFVPIITICAIGVAFVVAGIKLKSALITGTRWIQTMLVISGVVLCLNGALIKSVFGFAAGDRMGSYVGGVMMTVYLHRSVRRLATDAAARDGIALPPPPAKVV